jgi:PPM family protein phosphatase
MKVTVVSLSHTGKVREHNEDALWVDKNHGLYLVADGMGGHACGEVASQLAVDTIKVEITRGNNLSSAIQISHQAILDAGVSNAEQQGMGTTIVAAKQNKLGFELAWVGDSRIYHYDGNALTQLSIDHSFVQDMVLRDVLTEEQARNHPDSCLLRQALGKPDLHQVKVDCLKWPAIKPGILLLCSDGLSDKLSHEEMQRTFAEIVGSEIVDNADADSLTQGECLKTISDQLQSKVMQTTADDNFTWVLLGYKPSLWQRHAARWF